MPVPPDWNGHFIQSSPRSFISSILLLSVVVLRKGSLVPLPLVSLWNKALNTIRCIDSSVDLSWNLAPIRMAWTACSWVTEQSFDCVHDAIAPQWRGPYRRYQREDWISSEGASLVAEWIWDTLTNHQYREARSLSSSNSIPTARWKVKKIPFSIWLLQSTVEVIVILHR
jgi:hypothetical protein